MGMATNIIIFMMLLSFWLQTTKADSYSSVFTQLLTSFGNGSSSSLFNTIFFVGGITTVAAIVGTFVFPNPYALFAPVVVFLLFGFTFPIGIFNTDSGIDPQMQALITGIFGVLYLLAIVAWWKGGETP